jgi:hypothetical protein
LVAVEFSQVAHAGGCGFWIITPEHGEHLTANSDAKLEGRTGLYDCALVKW